jgi:hypothetical protein
VHIGDIEVEFDTCEGLEEVEEEEEENPTHLEETQTLEPLETESKEEKSSMPLVAYALASNPPASGNIQWDLYDSGASHHMSSCWEDFLSYQEIKPKLLTAANKEVFMAHGIGDIIISVNTQIKCLHLDRGGEYLSNKFISYLDEQGVERKLTVHDTPEENGLAERLNCTLMEKVRAMIIASQLPQALWGVRTLQHTERRPNSVVLSDYVRVYIGRS